MATLNNAPATLPPPLSQAKRRGEGSHPSRAQRGWLGGGRVLRVLASLCAVALCLSPSLAAAQEPSPTGPWACQHQRPDGTITKDCVVVVELNGESYLVKWQVEGNAWEGTGVLHAGQFAVAFVDTKKNVFGIALYKHDAGRWVGHWSVSGNPRLWSEVWTLP